MKKRIIIFLLFATYCTTGTNSGDIYAEINKKIEKENKEIDEKIKQLQDEKEETNQAVQLLEEQLKNGNDKSEQEEKALRKELGQLYDDLVRIDVKIRKLKKSKKAKMNILREVGQGFKDIGEQIGKKAEKLYFGTIKEDTPEAIIKAGEKVVKKVIGEKTYQQYFADKPYIVPDFLKNLHELLKRKDLELNKINREVFNLFNSPINNNFSEFFALDSEGIVSFSEKFQDILTLLSKTRNKESIKIVTAIIKDQLLKRNKIKRLNRLRDKIQPAPKRSEHKIYRFSGSNKTKTLIVQNKKTKIKLSFDFKKLGIKNNINVIFELKNKEIFLIHDKNKIIIFNPKKKHLTKKATLPKIGAIEKIYIINNFDIALVSKRKQKPYPAIFVYRYLTNKIVPMSGKIREKDGQYRFYKYNSYLESLSIKQLVTYTYLEHQFSTINISKIKNEKLFRIFESLPKQMQKILYNAKKIKFSWAGYLTWKLSTFL